MGDFPVTCPSCNHLLQSVPGIGAVCPNPTCNRIDDLTEAGVPRYTLFTPPIYAGYYDILGTRHQYTRRPSWIHRTFTRLLLGWVWHDLPSTDTGC
jgi:hypothetical protein